MLTIFTIPKPFRGKINIIQRNAILSWLKLFPKCEVILFGDDEGVSETAKEFGILHIPGIEKTELGTPLLSSAVNLAQKSAKNEILLYLNADIILMSDLIPAIQKVKNSNFLISGQRMDVDINEEIDFNNSDWENKLREKIRETGKLHGPTGMDYFVFPRNLSNIIQMPALAVGRAGWDNWLIYKVRSLKIPMIDATETITVAHQNHDYSHSKYGNLKKGKVMGPEAQRNFKLAGGFSNMCTLRDADWVLTSNGLRRPLYPRRIFAQLALFYPWRLLLALKRWLFS
ncbi:MAG: glycosyltransferase family A protein [Candidatus Wildermuthbacteria bacterium]|nr:glycosyltransferase family A protein [Candidatus Wildermuthbacteria bacterium]